MSDQVQKSGHHSNNIQIFQSGADPDEVRQLVLDVVRAELYVYQQRASVEVDRRLNEITDLILEKAQAINDDARENFSDPDIQFNLATVGREYARTGDANLGETLVELLMDRCKVENRSLMAVVLNDAIQTAARLTDAELAVLSLAWRLGRTIWRPLTSLVALEQYLDTDVLPFADLVPEGEATYYHLQYAGCLTADGFIDANLGTLFRNTYPGIFNKGFRADEVPEQLRPFTEFGGLAVTSLRDPTLMQLNALDDAVIEEKCASLGISELTEQAKALQSNHAMTPEEIEQDLIERRPALQGLAEAWRSGPMKNVRLTSVGIAVAHANYRRVTGLSTELSQWIS